MKRTHPVLTRLAFIGLHVVIAGVIFSLGYHSGPIFVLLFSISIVGLHVYAKRQEQEPANVDDTPPG